jgi:colanic acid biosynthesis protein WcaH
LRNIILLLESNFVFFLGAAVYLDKTEFLGIIHKTPLVSIDLIIRDEQNAILVGRRINRPAQGTWFVPGGRIRKDELLKDAFARISAKELGITLDIKTADFLGVFEHLYADNYGGSNDFGTHYVVLGYQVQISAQQISPPTEQHTDYCWLSETQVLENPEVHEYTKAYFQNGISTVGLASSSFSKAAAR